jgi:hypothetical protein
MTFDDVVLAFLLLFMLASSVAIGFMLAGLAPS